MERPLVYKSQTRDATTKLPVVIIDTTALPEDGHLPDPSSDVPLYLAEFPESSFVVVFLASRASRAPNLTWIRRVHGMLDRKLKKSIVKIYVVHAKWYTRALNRAIGPVVSPKFSRKIEHIKDLTELSWHMDITAIDFNPAVYLDDMKRSESDEILIPKNYDCIFGAPLTHVPAAYWRAALIYLKNVAISQSALMPLSRAGEQEATLARVLINAVKREQRLRLVDYGPHATLITLKEYLTCLPEPLIDICAVPLPLQDTEQYLSRVLAQVRAPAFLHLDELMSWASSLSPQNATVEVAKSLGPSIMGLRNPSREQRAVSVRFTRSLIEHWPLETCEQRKRLAPREVLNEQAVKSAANKPPVLPRRPPVTSEAIEINENTGLMPRNCPSEVTKAHRMQVPNRRAFGRVAEIMKKYDESQYV